MADCGYDGPWRKCEDIEADGGLSFHGVRDDDAVVRGHGQYGNGDDQGCHIRERGTQDAAQHLGHTAAHVHTAAPGKG